jgi:6-phosphogluconolactonase (cycloisomerase 2 family)
MQASVKFWSVMSIGWALAMSLRAEVLYVANPGGNSVDAFKIDSNGALTHLSDLSAVIKPSSLAVDPFGRFLYVTNHDGSPESEFGGTGGPRFGLSHRR